jgi:hypothetical protein
MVLLMTRLAKPVPILCPAANTSGGANPTQAGKTTHEGRKYNPRIAGQINNM